MNAMDIIGALLIAIGALLAAIAALGLVRLPDSLNRMHAASKPQTLGILLLCIGLACILRSWPATTMLALAAMLQLATSPVATLMIARSAYRTGQYRKDLIVEDEEARYEEDLRAAAADQDAEADTDAETSQDRGRAEGSDSER